MNSAWKTAWETPLSDDLMEEAYQIIRDQLEYSPRGEVRNTLQNFVTALTYDPIFAGNIRRNLFMERMALTCPVWWMRKSELIDDTDAAYLRLYLEQHYGLSAEKLLYPALEIVAQDHAFHPVQDKLNGLPWDGVPRVREALHHFLGAEVNDTNEKYLRTFMLGAVERIFHPGCKFDLMLVLVGGQGAGKSTFVRYLAMEPDWFTDEINKLDDKEIYHRLSGHWICELSEMVATANAKSIEEIKAFLSRDKDFLRIAYDRYGSDHPRQSVFAGTTNRTDFLPLDRSGNRRFLPVAVNAGNAECHILDDPESSRHYFEQMWAEIMAQYRSGEYTIHLAKEDEAALVERQQEFRQEDTLSGRICTWLENCEHDKVCTLQIYRECLDHPYDEPKQYELREIREVVNAGIDSGEIKRWRRFTNARKFAKYGRQLGWEYVPEAAQIHFKEELAKGYTIVNNEMVPF